MNIYAILSGGEIVTDSVKYGMVKYGSYKVIAILFDTFLPAEISTIPILLPIRLNLDTW